MADVCQSINVFWPDERCRRKLQAAEKALQGAEASLETRDILGSIASNRATMAYTRYDPETAIIQAQRALEYLSPDNLPTRTLTTFTLGVGYMQKGDRTAATRPLRMPY